MTSLPDHGRLKEQLGMQIYCCYPDQFIYGLISTEHENKFLASITDLGNDDHLVGRKR